MTDLLSPEQQDAVLEIGTGLGYQTAVLAELAGQVWSVEIVEELASPAEARLQPARLLEGRYSCRRWVTRLGRTCALRQDLGDGGCRATTAGAARTAQARRAHGHADGPAEAQRLTVIDKEAAGKSALGS